MWVVSSNDFKNSRDSHNMSRLDKLSAEHVTKGSKVKHTLWYWIEFSHKKTLLIKIGDYEKSKGSFEVSEIV